MLEEGQDKSFSVLLPKDGENLTACFSHQQSSIVRFTLHAFNRDTLRCLEGSNWLNDEVINFYLNMLQVRRTPQLTCLCRGSFPSRSKHMQRPYLLRFISFSCLRTYSCISRYRFTYKYVYMWRCREPDIVKICMWSEAMPRKLLDSCCTSRNSPMVCVWP